MLILSASVLQKFAPTIPLLRRRWQGNSPRNTTRRTHVENAQKSPPCRSPSQGIGPIIYLSRIRLPAQVGWSMERSAALPDFAAIVIERSSFAIPTFRGADRPSATLFFITFPSHLPVQYGNDRPDPLPRIAGNRHAHSDTLLAASSRAICDFPNLQINKFSGRVKAKISIIMILKDNHNSTPSHIHTDDTRTLYARKKRF